MSITRVGEPFQVHHGFGKNGWAIRRWFAVYECHCGQRFPMQSRSESKTKSCGCMAIEAARKVLTGNTYRRTHNQVGSRTYKSWAQMRGRCNRPGHIEYKRYGGRGIKVCVRWNTFENFLEDMGERPAGKTIDRIDPNGSYEPGNCRWATPKEQARNKRNNVILTIGGVSKTVAEWAEHPRSSSDKNIYNRISLGWSHSEAVFGKTK